MKIERSILALAWVALGVPLAEFANPPVAQAIVGVPVSPVSVAGVARRTCRRTAVVATSASASAAASSSAAANQAAAASAAQASQAAAASAAAAQDAAASANAAAAKPAAQPPPPPPAPAAAAPASVMASLPDGCVAAGEVFHCGNATYKPYMQGGTIVYVLEPGK